MVREGDVWADLKEVREPCTHLQEEHSTESTVKCKGPEVRACRILEGQQGAVCLTSEKDYSPLSLLCWGESNVGRHRSWRTGGTRSWITEKKSRSGEAV